MRWTAGGDRVIYEGDLTAPTANIVTVACHINSIISDPNAKYCTIDVKDFYLGTPMKESEYLRVSLSTFPTKIVRHYNLLSLVENGHIMVEVRKGMYGLPRTGILVNTSLRTLLSKHGYT